MYREVSGDICISRTFYSFPSRLCQSTDVLGFHCYGINIKGALGYLRGTPDNAKRHLDQQLILAVLHPDSVTP